ncbi:hypothetical protein BKA66DRAFT_613740 [Pyrenochaeta sp. MPI-SDFR-AT-0127]|nr:hypothetical protein BKA66DRAFT_613740 [Pyrenochaeta sp. MPI-SDFR-AT-0127]
MLFVVAKTLLRFGHYHCFWLLSTNLCFQCPKIAAEHTGVQCFVGRTQSFDRVRRLTMVPYHDDAYLRTHETGFDTTAEDNTTCGSVDDPEISQQLSQMLQAVQDSNRANQLREPVDEFLARLRQKVASHDEAQDEIIKLSVARLIGDALLKPLGSVAGTHSEDAVTLLSMQIDNNFEYSEQLLAKARCEAYERGLVVGKEEGLREGVELGKLIGSSESHTTENAQGKAQGLSEERKLDPGRAFETTKRTVWDGATTDSIKWGQEEIKQKLDKTTTEFDWKGVETHGDALNKVVVRLPPRSPNKRKENASPRSLENDPFHSLLGLVRNKSIGRSPKYNTSGV